MHLDDMKRELGDDGDDRINILLYDGPAEFM